jgi:2-polyprenyl-6-methoxyphenol hydroxylase-like FAD-dependent oxidoreductase
MRKRLVGCLGDVLHRLGRSGLSFGGRLQSRAGALGWPKPRREACAWTDRCSSSANRTPNLAPWRLRTLSLIYDVVIAGAGPVGLFLACELRLADLADLAVLVLEQAEDPRSPLKRLPFGMRGLSIPTVEALDRRGLLDDLAASQPGRIRASPAAHWMQQERRPGGHFAGIQFFTNNIDTSKWPYRLPSPASAAMAADMEQIESVLAARASAMGAEIRRDLGVEDFNQSGEEVTIRADGETFRGRWLVGCDGGRSTVRRVGGFEFVGTDPEFTGYSVEVEMADPDKLRLGRHYTPTGMYTYSSPGTIAMVEFDGALSIELSRLRLTTCRGCCAVSPAPGSP